MVSNQRRAFWLIISSLEEKERDELYFHRLKKVQYTIWQLQASLIKNGFLFRSRKSPFRLAWHRRSTMGGRSIVPLLVASSRQLGWQYEVVSEVACFQSRVRKKQTYNSYYRVSLNILSFSLNEDPFDFYLFFKVKNSNCQEANTNRYLFNFPD